MITLPDDSPVHMIIPDLLGPDWTVMFQVYRVAAPGDQWKSERRLERRLVRDVPAFLAETTLDVDQELALTSAVTTPRTSTGRYGTNLMMADLAVTNKLALATWRAPEGSHLLSDGPVYYDTGRSYHAYWLATAGTLTGFYGELLTIREPFVDTRAIGYALRRGYTALRLTKNTDRYLKAPSRVLLS